MNPVERVQMLREGSNVRRCHTLPHHGEYTVGKHSGDALTLLFVLYPEAPSVSLIKALLWHDVTERFLGDLPSPAKNNCILLGRLYDELEEKWEKHLNTYSVLTPKEKHWLRAIDLLELFVWCLEQKVLGNQLVIHYLTVLSSSLANKWVPEPVYAFAADYLEYFDQQQNIRTNEVILWKQLMTPKTI